MLKIGDRVSVIHEVVSGEVISINGPKAIIVDAEGFEWHYNSSELAKIQVDNYDVDTHEATQFIQQKKNQLSNLKIRKVSENKINHSLVNSNEIDLHIEVLLPEAVHWAVGDILQKQMIACRSFVERSVANKMKQVTLIHGKGEGVLKSEIYRYLNRVEDQLHINVSYHDADYRTFGTGATQVNFRY